jgi:hypothetical protein
VNFFLEIGTLVALSSSKLPDRARAWTTTKYYAEAGGHRIDRIHRHKKDFTE